MSKPIALNRKGTGRKSKMNRSRMSRRKECPACGRKFATRPALRGHVEGAHLAPGAG
jgi:hypothetical protein